MQYAVFYASAGCLPDSEDIPTFDSIVDAAEYVRGEFMEVMDYDEWPEDRKVPSVRDIVEDMGVDDPRENSLYRWSIEPVEREDVIPLDQLTTDEQRAFARGAGEGHD